MAYWSDIRAGRKAEWKAAGGTVMSAGWTAQAMWLIFVVGFDIFHAAPSVKFIVHSLIVLGTIAMLAGSVKYTRYYALHPAWAIAGLFSVFGAAVLMLAARSREEEDCIRGFEVKRAAERSSIWRMTITVRFNGEFAQHTGGQDITMEMPKGAPVSTAVRMIGRVIPELSIPLQTARFFVKDERLKLKNELNPNDVLVIEPGGDPNRPFL
jgi:hypothetical protein